MQADRVERMMKRLAQRIAGAIARVEDAASQMSTASEPAAAAHWEEQRQQAAAEVEELVEERALLVEMIMEAPEPRAEQSLPEYLQQYHGVSTKVEYLDSRYREAYQKARPAKPGYRGRLPSTLRSLDQPFVRDVVGHDGVTYDVELGRQLELICRSHTVRAAIFFFAKIERNFISSSGSDTGLTRSVALMALIGAPGTGKTTLLTELVHLIREHIASHPQDCLNIIKSATGEREEGCAEQTLQRLLNSVSEGRELVCWLRLDKEPTLLPLEIEGPGPENTLALRLMYGFLTYFDSLRGSPSPAGTYQDFLKSLDNRVRVELVPEDAFGFLDVMTDQMPDKPRAVFVHGDEFNAARGPYPNDVPWGDDGLERNWAQRLTSTLVQYTDDQPNKHRLVLAVLGTSRHSVATLAGTATPRSEIAPLPLNSPLLRDIQLFLKGIWERLLLTTGGMERACEALEDEDSIVVQLACWAGGNFRLMAWMLVLFGGARTVYDHKWNLEELADWLSAERGRPAVRSVLEALHGGMEGQNWFNKLGALDVAVKLAILKRAIAHARTGVTVQLRLPVLRDLPSITWGDLLNEGLIQPMFLVEVTEDERRKRSIVRVAESPVRSPVLMAHGSRPWHDSARYGEMPDFSDEGALGSSGQQPPATPVTGATVEPVGPTGSPGLQSPATPAAGAAGQMAPSKTSPVLETVTPLGYRRVIDPKANLSAADIIIDLAPAVMAGLWRRLGLVDLSPLAETVYQESSAKKERVDLYCMMHPMLLRREELGLSWCRLVEVVRADWLPPWAAALRVELPDPWVLKDMGASFKGQLQPAYFPNVRAVAHAANLYKEGDSQPDLTHRAKQVGLSGASVGVIAADNFGTDSLLFLKLKSALALEDKFLDLFLQSKYTMGVTTQTFPYALAQTMKDTGRHHITAGKAPTVPELWGPEEPRPAKKKTPRRTAGERGEQQRRRDPAQGYFPGGTMRKFEEAVLDATEAHLLAWEEQLEKLGIQPPEVPHPFLCCFVTDHTMLSKEHARLRVLSLAGHPYASRMVFIDRAQQKTYYGAATATQRNLAKLQGNWGA